MKKNKFSLYFIFISFLTLLTILFSIVQKSYFNFEKPQKSVQNDALLTNFNPNLDLTVISTIESKDKNIEDNFDFSILKSGKTASTTPTPNPEATAAATPTATPISQPEASSSATTNETLTETTLTP